MKKIRPYVIPVLLAILLESCQTATATPPPPLNTTTDMEFVLAPGQSAALIDAVFTIRLLGVTSDERCPIEIECAASGPVSVSFTLQKGGGALTTVDLQTFTDNNGRAPDIEFEGIHDRTVYEGYEIRIVSVLPHPVNLDETISESDYRVTFIVAGE